WCDTFARRAISGIVSAASPFSATIAAVASTIRSRWLATIASRGRSLRPLGRRPSARRARSEVGTGPAVRPLPGRAGGAAGPGRPQLRGGAQRAQLAVLLGRLGQVGGDRGRGRALRDLVVGADEQLFLVAEQRVEGRLGHARQLGEIDDAHARIALLRDQL